jgi:hypothetical protein
MASFALCPISLHIGRINESEERKRADTPKQKKISCVKHKHKHEQAHEVFCYAGAKKRMVNEYGIKVEAVK